MQQENHTQPQVYSQKINYKEELSSQEEEANYLKNIKMGGQRGRIELIMGPNVCWQVH